MNPMNPIHSGSEKRSFLWCVPVGFLRCPRIGGLDLDLNPRVVWFPFGFPLHNQQVVHQHELLVRRFWGTLGPSKLVRHGFPYDFPFKPPKRGVALKKVNSQIPPPFRLIHEIYLLNAWELCHVSSRGK